MIKKFYTIQSKEAYENALSKGFLSCPISFVDESDRESYTWLYSIYAMKYNIIDSEYSLIWLWKNELPDYYYEKDDDSSEIYIYERLGENNLLLEIELEEEDVLMSNFTAWHVPLNNISFISKEETIREESGGFLLTKYNWGRLFDREWLIENEYIYPEDTLEQGVVPTIQVSKISNVFSKSTVENLIHP